MPNIQSFDRYGNSRQSRSRGPRVSSVLSEINVVPLVDVMLVLLIIFMVAAPLLQRGLNVNLPEARRADPISEERIFITVPLSFRTDGQIMVDEDFVSLEALNERISRDMEGQTDRSVFLRGDGEITYQELMDVIDRLKESGVEEVGLLSRAPSNQ